MEAFLEEFQHLRIRLEAVNLATNNFDESNVIGRGGFGKVYAGLLIHSKGTHKAAFKRLNRDHGQGDPQFWKEIMMLSGYTHENLISLLGFCDEGGEKIVVYERACHGSLDKHLSSTNVTWCQRLKICLTAARGLCYLHDPHGTHQRVIHRDVKSSNILLDENWNAKVADMGLSKFGPANQPHSFLPTNVAGTHGYIDPLYMKTCSLTKESDIYSFGVVLFEVLCGRLCYKFNNGTFESLVPIWKQSYEKNQLDHIIFKCLAQYMDLRSLEMFSDIAYRCLNEFREKRPQMSDVVEKLENALHFQEISEEVEPPMDYEQMIMTAKRPLVYSSEKELKTLLSKGILLNRGLTWFLLTKTGEHCHMISAAECLLPVCSESREYSDDNKFASLKTARFTFKADYLAIVRRNFKTHVKTQFLSPHTTYAVNLVFQFCYEEITWLQRKNFADLNYKLAGEGKFSNLFLIEKRDDGWLKAELYQFTSNRRSIDLEIMFEYRKDSLVVQGIEFQPVERVEPEALEDEEVDMQTHPDKYWEKKLPTDYKKIIQLSDITVKWTTKKELYDILCKGFPCKAGKEWFCLAKNGEKCRMLSPRVALLDREWRWGSLPESRFEEVAFDPYRTVFRIECKSYLVSPQTIYKCYLVYKFKYDPQFRLPVEVYVGGDSWYIFLLTPQIPVIRRKVYQNTHNPLNRPKAKYLPKQRNDGWMEVLLWEFRTGITNESTISKNITLTALDENFFRGLIVQGIEFKTI